MSFYGYNPIPSDYSYMARAGQQIGAGVGAAGAAIGAYAGERKFDGDLSSLKAERLEQARTKLGIDPNDSNANLTVASMVGRHYARRPGESKEKYRERMGDMDKGFEKELTGMWQNTNYAKLSEMDTYGKHPAMVKADKAFQDLLSRTPRSAPPMGATQGVQAGDPRLTSTQFSQRPFGGITADKVVGDVQGLAEESTENIPPSKRYHSSLKIPYTSEELRRAGENAAALGKISAEQQAMWDKQGARQAELDKEESKRARENEIYDKTRGHKLEDELRELEYNENDANLLAAALAFSEYPDKRVAYLKGKGLKYPIQNYYNILNLDGKNAQDVALRLKKAQAAAAWKRASGSGGTPNSWDNAVRILKSHRDTYEQLNEALQKLNKSINVPNSRKRATPEQVAAAKDAVDRARDTHNAYLATMRGIFPEKMSGGKNAGDASFEPILGPGN